MTYQRAVRWGVVASIPHYANLYRVQSVSRPNVSNNLVVYLSTLTR